jgi:hypothetical protein
MKFYQQLLFIFLLSVFSNALFAQGKIYDGPDDKAGDKAAEREGYMTGNRVFLYFQNTTELANWVAGVGPPLWSRWPNSDDGVRMLDGISLLIGARVYLENNVPVTDPLNHMGGPLDTLYFLQTSYREEMDVDPTGQIEWGLYPVFGYFNENNEYPAMSNIADSWPSTWPSTGLQTKWPGEWNGRFGRGVIYADLETYFVANDAMDQEYLGQEDVVKYYPRPGVLIDSDNTLQPGLPWGGIGVRVSQRGFQWNNPQARDAIFWEYSIANISDYDLPEVAFGYWVDNGIGGESDDEIGFFDRQLDMAYSWDNDGIGRGGLRPGVMGFAYLESPGIPYDGVDNDGDGLNDEQRDNQAVAIVGADAGIEDLSRFLEFYGLEMEDLKDHWDADEDQDWIDGEDTNNNNSYAYFDTASNEWLPEPGESANDDVGVDGVGPFDLNYDGPDLDGTEGNHKPDYVAGIGSEPNFATTDVSESDMIGLTSFRLFPIQSHASEYRWFRGDRSMWELIGEDSTLEFLGNISNLVETFASGPFPLFQGHEERISMSELHAYDDLLGLQSEGHRAPALFAAKRIVQVIYESDYRFAQPPLMPTLTATPSDGKVILTWDDDADTKTREPFLRNINDFEGYKLYRATDKRFSDAYQITTGRGDPSILKPIIQWDLVDGISGFANFGQVEGTGFYLGDETGIVHHFVDETVQNGRTYYYALVAYDFGAPDIGGGISPSENNIIIDLDEQENIRFSAKNVAVVVPRPVSAGYIPPSVESDEAYALGTASVTAEILAKNDVKVNHQYKIEFDIDTLQVVADIDNGVIYTTNGFRIYDVTENGSLVYSETPDKYSYSNIQSIESIPLGTVDTLRYHRLNPLGAITDVFDGIRILITPEVEFAEYDYQNSGWLTGSSPMLINPAVSSINFYPWDYQIIFTNNDSAYVSFTARRNLRDETNSSIVRNDLIMGQNFNFYVQNISFPDSNGQFKKLELIVHDLNRNGTFEILEDRVLAGPVDDLGRYAGTAFAIDFRAAQDASQLPQPNDVYNIKYRRPLWKNDAFYFTTVDEDVAETEQMKSLMDKIKVVPNPYIATNLLEEAVQNVYLNQRRRIMFTHLPASCEIKIFTVSGLLVRAIDVDNTFDNGIAYWDLLTSENLEVAAGIYLYHVKAKATGDSILGKFAIIK